jgi:hypothetical protein
MTATTEPPTTTAAAAPPAVDIKEAAAAEAAAKMRADVEAAVALGKVKRRGEEGGCARRGWAWEWGGVGTSWIGLDPWFFLTSDEHTLCLILSVGASRRGERSNVPGARASGRALLFLSSLSLRARSVFVSSVELRGTVLAPGSARLSSRAHRSLRECDPGHALVWVTWLSGVICSASGRPLRRAHG